MKRCPGCGKEKPWSAFPRNKNTRDGLAFYCEECHNQKVRESKERNNAGYSAYHRKHRYGVTKEDIEALLARQDGKCPICRTRPPTHLDHDHQTGEVRDMLCFGCNGGLGQFQDNINWLIRAVIYLLGRDYLNKEAS
jgi:recombination endonuclease VII